MVRKLIRVVSVLLFFAGACILAYPWAREFYMNEHDSRIIDEFEKMRVSSQSEAQKDAAGDSESPDSTEEWTPVPVTGGSEDLYADMKSYNREIFENGQDGLSDAWNYEQPVFLLDEYGMDSEIIGYIESDAMGIRLPLYIGSSYEHLSMGACVLGQTSMPVGGENTNCVIAGHRGWQGSPMFRDIEALSEGDIIWVTNLWERLAYRVVRISVIMPDDIDAVKIVEGEDMLTLFTCHPYTGNTYRYVVYCTRTYDAVYGETAYEEPEAGDKELSDLLDKRQQEHPVFVSSADKISREKTLSAAGLAGAALLAAVLVIFLFLTFSKRKKRTGKGEK